MEGEKVKKKRYRGNEKREVVKVGKKKKSWQGKEKEKKSIKWIVSNLSYLHRKKRKDQKEIVLKEEMYYGKGAKPTGKEQRGN